MIIARFTPPGTGQAPQFGLVQNLGPDGSAHAATVRALAGDPMLGRLTETGRSYDLAAVKLLAPVIPRSKVVGVGRNYRDHAAELATLVGDDAPAEAPPVFFLKPNTSVIGPDAPIMLPAASSEVHHEAELAVVIGKICKDLDRADVPRVVFGYTCANDVTARDLQRADGQWTRAKGFDTFCPLGPWIVTDLDPSDLPVRAEVNREPRQHGTTADMRYSVTDLVVEASRMFTLLPGDVILTGTPAGVGPIVDGDQVTVEIGGIGRLVNPVVRA